MGKWGKRKYPYRHSSNKNQSQLDVGTSGLFFTYSGNEKIAIQEAFSVIDMALESDKSLLEASGSQCVESQAQDDASKESEDESSEDGDIADSVKRFCSQAKATKFAPDRMKLGISRLNVGAKCCVFIRVNKPELASRLADKICTMAAEKPCCRYLQRVLPVEMTCTSDLNTVNQELTKLVARSFVAGEDGKWPTYSVEFMRRNSEVLKLADVLNMVDDAVSQLAPSCRVNLGDPELSLIIQLVRNMVLISCVRRFVSRKRFSLHNAGNKPVTKQKSKSSEQPAVESESCKDG